jgi:phosphonate transport system ATP-binding protein
MVALMGPSGVGKTTFLDCIMGAAKPLPCGTLQCTDRIARVHQDLRLVRESSALTNVLHGCLASSTTLAGHLVPRLLFSPIERERARALLQSAGLGERLTTPVRYLSIGEQQRVAVCRALMASPRLLLADEPVAALDNESASMMLTLMRTHARTHALAVLCVLHNLDMARAFCDRVILLSPTGTLAKE